MHKKIYYIFFAILINGCASTPQSVQEYRSGLKSRIVDGYQMAYVDKGNQNGDVIVLLHGMPTSSYLYRNIINGLTENNFRVIAPDFIGFGGSDKPQTQEAYSLENQAKRMKLFLQAIKVSKAHFVVHDMGGLIAWEMMTKDPDIFKSLLVLNSTAYTQGFNPPSEMQMMAGLMGGAMAFMMESRLMGPSLIKSFLSDYMSHSERLSQEDIDQYWWPIHEGATYPMRFIAKNFNNIISRFPVYQEQLRNFDKPVLILWGEQDQVLNYKDISTQLQQDLRIPPNKIASIQDSGHFIQEDAPEAVVKKILELTQL